MSVLPNPVWLLWSSVKEGLREGGGRVHVQLFAMAATNGSALHSLTWYSCKNRLPSSGSHEWERQCPPLFYRHILWSQLPHQPHSPSHVSVMHIWPPASAGPLAQLGPFLGLLTSWYFLYKEELNSVGAQFYILTVLELIPTVRIGCFLRIIILWKLFIFALIFTLLYLKRSFF